MFEQEHGDRTITGQENPYQLIYSLLPHPEHLNLFTLIAITRNRQGEYVLIIKNMSRG